MNVQISECRRAAVAAIESVFRGLEATGVDVRGGIDPAMALLDADEWPAEGRVWNLGHSPYEDFGWIADLPPVQESPALQALIGAAIGAIGDYHAARRRIG